MWPHRASLLSQKCYLLHSWTLVLLIVVRNCHYWCIETHPCYKLMSPPPFPDTASTLSEVSVLYADKERHLLWHAGDSRCLSCIDNELCKRRAFYCDVTCVQCNVVKHSKRLLYKISKKPMEGTWVLNWQRKNPCTRSYAQLELLHNVWLHICRLLSATILCLSDVFWFTHLYTE